MKVPATKDEVLKSDISDTTQTNYYRLRTSYDKLDGMSAFSYTTKDAAGATQKVTINLENATDQTGTNVDGSNFTYKTATAVDAGGAAKKSAKMISYSSRKMETLSWEKMYHQNFGQINLRLPQPTIKQGLIRAN